MYDKTEEAEFTAAWDRYKQRFNPFIACPECEGCGRVEYERWVLTSNGVHEPVGEWRDCKNCSGTGDVESDL